MAEKDEIGYEEAKLSGGPVFQAGVAMSKHSKAIRRIAQPLTEKHWRDTGQDVVQLHRIYRVAEYLYKRQRRNK